MASKKDHPADAADRALIAQAAGFTASMFVGAGQFEKAQAATLDEARQHAAAFADRIKNGRKPMIYAALADGRHIFVPDNYQPETKAMTTKTETNTATDKPAAPARAAKPAKAKAAKKKAAKKKAAQPAAKKKDGKGGNGARPLGKRAAILAAAKAGKLPPVPDFSAPTHERFRKKLAEVVALAKAGDIRKLKAYEINPVSSSPKAIARYRDLAVIALTAKGR